MSPAKVTTPDLEIFVVPTGQRLNNSLNGFNKLSDRAQRDLAWFNITGLPKGYAITGNFPTGNYVKIICQKTFFGYKISGAVEIPDQYSIKFNPEKGAITLSDGSTISPITESEARGINMLSAIVDSKTRGSKERR